MQWHCATVQHSPFSVPYVWSTWCFVPFLRIQRPKWLTSFSKPHKSESNPHASKWCLKQKGCKVLFYLFIWYLFDIDLMLFDDNWEYWVNVYIPCLLQAPSLTLTSSIPMNPWLLVSLWPLNTICELRMMQSLMLPKCYIKCFWIRDISIQSQKLKNNLKIDWHFYGKVRFTCTMSFMLRVTFAFIHSGFCVPRRVQTKSSDDC